MRSDGNKLNLPQRDDDIAELLRDKGINLSRLDRLEQLSAEMQHLEWSLLRRAAQQS